MSTITIKIKPTSGGSPFEVTVESVEATIETLKEEVSKVCDVPAAQLRLIYKVRSQRTRLQERMSLLFHGQGRIQCVK